MKNFAPILVLLLLLAAVPCLAQLTSSPEVTPLPPPAPSPAPTPKPLSLELYFRRPAKIIPWYEEKKIETVEEVPWLTQDDFARAKVFSEDDQHGLRIYLTPSGKQKLREAMMGNVGRTIVFVVEGRARNAFKMVPVRRKDRIHISGNFSRQEAEKIAAQINYRPTPSPIPTPFPTATPR